MQLSIYEQNWKVKDRKVDFNYNLNKGFKTSKNMLQRRCIFKNKVNINLYMAFFLYLNDNTRRVLVAKWGKKYLVSHKRYIWY